MTKNRSYEISIWTLQDEFISVLKPSEVENKGCVYKPVVTKKTDSTDTCTFSIPKFLFLEDTRILNPIWGDIKQGNFTKNLHKIKVIFNKGTDVEEVIEFIILNVKDKHENDQVFTEISCESLAFHELGKRGYKISLTAEGFYKEYNDWFDSDMTEDEPHNTLQYWTEKFMEPVPDDTTLLDCNTWYYDIQMDWSSYAPGRDGHKVYEEEYTASWEVQNETLVPSRIEQSKEKERLVDIENSNIYNITQKLAETFGVFCKYVYLYDSTYRITGRRIIYYNNYIREQEGYLDLTYPYTASAITREREGKDVTTKMFVETVQSEKGNTITIMDNESNKSQEDYLLNFDYLKQIGELTQEQIQGISDYETEMRQLNISISNLQNTINNLNILVPDVESEITILKNSIGLSQERIEESDDLLNNLDIQDGSPDGRVSITENGPDVMVLLEDKNITNLYYLTITRVGIDVSSLHIYATMNYGSSVTSKLTDEILNWKSEFDEYGNLCKITNLVKPATMQRNRVYLTYNYAPKLYYEVVKQTWTARLARDEAALADAENRLAIINTNLETLRMSLDACLVEKQKKIQLFEQLMGPALRESYWQPDDYDDYGNRYLDTLNPNDLTVVGDSGFSSFLWDSTLFDGEQNSYYRLGITETQKNYPCINLKPYLDKIHDHLDELSFLFYDYNIEEVPGAPSRVKALSIYSQAQYGFVTQSGQIIPVLILTGIEGMTQGSLNRLVNNQPKLGKLTTQVNSITGEISTTIDSWVSLTPSDFINCSNTTDRTFSAVDLRYPRIKIDSFKLKDMDQDGVNIKINGHILDNYKDFYILARDLETTTIELDTDVNTDYNTNPFYCITIKPNVILQYGIDYTITNSVVTNFTYNSVIINFVLSNASTAIYLDAIQVLKENAFPKVSYTVTPSVFDKTFVYSAYDKLNRIVNINDTDLHLVNIQGYFSQIEMNLDEPWNDKYEIKNYRNKFEDLFSNIVAQTEAMQRNEFTMTLAANALTPDGLIKDEVLQNTFRRVDFDYAFNNGALTIDETNGIWGTSDNGVVAFRGGGIFTATSQNENGDWQWNTGITPEGINADLITTGQLDTNRINIYAGDKIRFQMNSEGLYAYKSISEDARLLNIAENDSTAATLLQNNANFDLDKKQYVVHNDNGLFLIAEPGAYIPITETTVEQGEEITTSRIKVLSGDTSITRAEISWDGLILRNWNNTETFYADPDTGNLNVIGTITAQGLESQGDLHVRANDRIIIDGETVINGNLIINTQGAAVVEGIVTNIIQPTADYYETLKNVVIIDEAGVHINPKNELGISSPYSTLTDSTGFHIYQDNTVIASFAAKGTTVQRLYVGDIVVKETNSHGWAWVPA